MKRSAVARAPLRANAPLALRRGRRGAAREHARKHVAKARRPRVALRKLDAIFRYFPELVEARLARSDDVHRFADAHQIHRAPSVERQSTDELERTRGAPDTEATSCREHEHDERGDAHEHY